MTRDELLAKIQSDYEDNKHFRDERNWKSFAALGAVVELHSPPETTDGVTRWIANNCAACTHGNPCPTLKAIEKELS